MTNLDGFDQPLSRADHIIATAEDPEEREEALLDAQMIALAERPKDDSRFAKGVHFAMAFELACGRPIRRTMSSGIKTPRLTSTNNLRYVTCKKCLHALSNLAMVRLDDVLIKEKEVRDARSALP